MEVANADEAIRANLGPGLDPEAVFEQFNSDDIKQIEDLIDSRFIRNLIPEEAAGGSGCIPNNVGYTDTVPTGVGGTGPLDNPNLKASPQRVPPSTHPGPPPGYHAGHPAHMQQGPGQQGAPHPQHQAHIGSKNQQFVPTQFPESPPDSGSEPYSPPNDNNPQQHQDNVQYNVKPNGMPNMAPGAHHMYMVGGHGPPTGTPHSHGPPSGPPNMHSSNSPPHGQHSSPPHPIQVPGQPPSHMRPYVYPMNMGSEPPKLQHPAANNALPLNVHSLPNPESSLNNLANQPAKKRKFSDSPNSTVNQHYIQQMVACMTPGLNIKQEPGLLDCAEDDYYDPQMFMDGAFQVIKWQAFQQNKWAVLLDEHGKELPPLNYRVDADKGFNYSPSDDSFVCQKKNHFQVTVHVGLSGVPKYVKTPEGVVKTVDSFYLHFNGIKAESVSQTIRVEQSQSDRTKRPFHPVKVELTPDQVNKFTVGRMHFSETTSNNMRKKGKPNPDQRYFMLVVALHAHHGDENYILAAHKSERIIVRASNPGQFDSDVDTLWNKGRSPDSVVHMGRVGINNDAPDEALTVHGNIHVTGALIQPSDRRAKTNIKELDTKEQLRNINLLKVYKYAYDERFANFAGLTDDEKEDTGVLAQELAEVLPDAVKETGDIILPDGEKIENFMVVNKDRIFMESIGAVKELCKVTDKLETRINEIEGIDKKLHKYGSITSTCSSFSFSTCSTISRSSSLQPPSDGKSPNKKSSDKSTNEKQKSTSGSGSKHHHHHHHHQSNSHHHTSSRRCGNTQAPTAPDTGPCNSRLIQIMVIVLVLVMAFCLAAVTTLYMLEKKQNEQKQNTPPVDSTAPLSSTTAAPGSSDTSIGMFQIARVGHPQDVADYSYITTDLDLTRPNSSTPKGTTPANRRNGTSMPPQLTPPHCLVHTCNVTCCNRVSNQHLDDPQKWPSHGRPRSEQSVIPKDLKNKTVTDIPYKILPPDGQVYISSTQSWNVEDYQPPPREAPTLKAERKAPRRKSRPNYTKSKLPSQVMERENELPISDPSATNDIREDYVAEPDNVDMSNQPQILVMNSDDNHHLSRRKRETDFHNSPATLLFEQINKTIDHLYCVSDNCYHGGNYSYYIPMSPVFPQAFISISFQMRATTEKMEVHLCEEEEVNVCDELSSDEDVKIMADKNYGNVWDLPVGYYFESYFKFRVAQEGQSKAEVCKLSKQLVGQTYSEYNLSFKRICDGVPSS